MKTSLFDYELPESAIAQHPLADREASRLLVLGRNGVEHRTFADFADLVPEGALVVLNDTRVINARLLGTRPGTLGRVELLLVRRLEVAPDATEVWVAMGRASRPIREGTRVDVGPIRAEVEGREPDGLYRVRLAADGGVGAAIEAHGHVPLPPYMRRGDEPADRHRYQTVFARHEGSIAAPTAGLHVTPRTLERLRARGVEVATVTLHVGIGTFRPVTAEDLDDHAMHSEEFVVGEDLASAVARARSRGGRVVAIGTTCVRALESAADPSDPSRVTPTARETSLLIQPGHRFGPVDALLTNFHMPRSTLLSLVSAFAGRDRIMAAYAEALERGYRFLSYGDAMWIPERAS